MTGEARRSNRWIVQAVWCVGWIALGSWLRWELRTVPNVSPVAALALYGGFLFSRRSIAVFVVVCTMAITDTFLGGYEPGLMVAVYAMLAFPALWGSFLRRAVGRYGRVAFAGMTFAASLVGSIAFFAVTNFACWWSSPWYAPNWAGLIECYGAALPFFRYTLLGDLGFTALFFGAHAVVLGVAARPTAVAAQ